jgi:hypothetical protein
MASLQTEDGRSQDQRKPKGKLEDYAFIEKQTKTGPSSELGRGAYGVVRLVQNKKTQRQFAMKIVGSALADTTH